MEELKNGIYLDNSAWDLLLFGGIILISFILRRFFSNSFSKIVFRFIPEESISIQDCVQLIRKPFELLIVQEDKAIEIAQSELKNKQIKAGSTLAIKVKIGDREYPMRVKPEDEGKIRHAGRVINEKLRKYKSEFGLDDSTDLLAMVAFDCMVESLETNAGNAEDSEQIERSLVHISALLAKAV